MLRTQAITEDNDAQKKMAQDFFEIYEEEWHDRIVSLAQRSLDNKKFNNPQLVPLVEDVCCLNRYLISELELARRELEHDSAASARYAELCLSQVILFNRRRSGEASRVKIMEYQSLSKDRGQVDETAKKVLSPFEQFLCKTHYRIEIQGKRGRRVPVLFTKEMKNNMDFLLAHRPHSQSQYVFVRNESARHQYRGCNSLRKHAQQSGAKRPELLTSTRLRKQLGTLAQLLNLGENGQDILAGFMGHDIRIHREFYRLPVHLIQIAKMAKVLHLMNEGQIAKFQGKDFDEITFDENGM